MKKKYSLLIMLYAAVLFLTLYGCGGSSNPPDSNTNNSTTSTGPTTSTTIDGAALYAADCQSCHGPLATSEKKGATVTTIRFGITNDLGGMGQFAGLSPDQLQALADVLSTSGTSTSGSSTSTSIDGAALYEANCSPCHGSLATSSKKNATATMIQTGISNNFGGMGKFSTFTAAQIQAIAAALSTTVSNTTTSTSTSTGGAALYTTNCSGCHGALATSSKLGRTAVQIQAAIGSVGAMSGLSSLTSAQIQAIATALAPVTTTPTPTTPTTLDGVALYTTNCSGCHGALATSSKIGRTASQITAAIGSVGAMSGLSSLTSAQIQAIATALAPVTTTPTPTTTTPPPTTLDGAALYAANCQSCHGPLATSSKRGRTAAQILTAIGSVGAMSSVSNLTMAQIDAIAAALK